MNTLSSSQHYIFKLNEELSKSNMLVFDNINKDLKLKRIAFYEIKNKIKLFIHYKGNWVEYVFLVHFVLICETQNKALLKMFKKVKKDYKKNKFYKKKFNLEHIL